MSQHPHLLETIQRIHAEVMTLSYVARGVAGDELGIALNAMAVRLNELVADAHGIAHDMTASSD